MTSSLFLLPHGAVVTVDPYPGAANPYLRMQTPHFLLMELGAALVALGGKLLLWRGELGGLV